MEPKSSKIQNKIEKLFENFRFSYFSTIIVFKLAYFTMAVEYA